MRRNCKEKGRQWVERRGETKLPRSSTWWDSLPNVRCHIARPNSTSSAFWKTKYLRMFSWPNLKKWIPPSHMQRLQPQKRKEQAILWEQFLPPPDFPPFSFHFLGKLIFHVPPRIDPFLPSPTQRFQPTETKHFLQHKHLRTLPILSAPKRLRQIKRRGSCNSKRIPC